jgi:hypothetical protein
MKDCEKVARTVLEMESAEQISEFLANDTILSSCRSSEGEYNG